MTRIRTPYHYAEGFAYVDWLLVDFYIEDDKIAGLDAAAAISPDTAAAYVREGQAQGWMIRIPIGE